MREPESSEMITLAELTDDNSTSIEEEFGDAMARVEADIQRHMRRHDGEVPAKPYSIPITIKVEPRSAHGRVVTYEVGAVKAPKTSKSHSIQARAVDGAIVPLMARQTRMNYTVPEDDPHPGD